MSITEKELDHLATLSKLKLTPEERYAIRWHMGFSEPKDNYSYLGKAMEKYPLICALHEADLEATYLLESSDG